MVCGDKFVIVSANLLRHVEPYLRHLAAVGCYDVRPRFCRHMQHNVIVGLVFVVSVRIPVGCLVVYLDVSYPHSAAYSDLRVEEVGPRVGVGQTCVYHLNALARGGKERPYGKHLVLPYIMKKLFHKRVFYAVLSRLQAFVRPLRPFQRNTKIRKNPVQDVSCTGFFIFKRRKSAPSVAQIIVAHPYFLITLTVVPSAFFRILRPFFMPFSLFPLMSYTASTPLLVTGALMPADS